MCFARTLEYKTIAPDNICVLRCDIPVVYQNYDVEISVNNSHKHN